MKIDSQILKTLLIPLSLKIKKKTKPQKTPLNIFLWSMKNKYSPENTNSHMFWQEIQIYNILNIFEKAAHFSVCCNRLSRSAILLQSWINIFLWTSKYMWPYQGQEACTSDFKWIYITSNLRATCWTRLPCTIDRISGCFRCRNLEGWSSWWWPISIHWFFIIKAFICTKR